MITSVKITKEDGNYNYFDISFYDKDWKYMGKSEHDVTGSERDLENHNSGSEDQDEDHANNHGDVVAPREGTVLTIIEHK